jgi:hypothetical protein
MWLPIASDAALRDFNVADVSLGAGCWVQVFGRR